MALSFFTLKLKGALESWQWDVGEAVGSMLILVFGRAQILITGPHSVWRNLFGLFVLEVSVFSFFFKEAEFFKKEVT